MAEILDVDLLRVRAGRRRGQTGGGRRRPAQPRDRVRVHQPRPVRGPARHHLRACWRSSSTLPARGQAAVRRAGRPRQTGYTGLLVETAASSDEPDWKEMLNWSAPIGRATRCKRKFPHRLPRPAAPRGGGARHHRGAVPLPRLDRRPAASLPAGHRRGHRLPRDVLRRHGRRRPDADPGDPLPGDVRARRRRRPRVGRRARRHQPHHRAAARHGARAAGEGRRRLGRRRRRPTAR